MVCLDDEDVRDDFFFLDKYGLLNIKRVWMMLCVFLWITGLFELSCCIFIF